GHRGRRLRQSPLSPENSRERVVGLRIVRPQAQRAAQARFRVPQFAQRLVDLAQQIVRFGISRAVLKHGSVKPLSMDQVAGRMARLGLGNRLCYRGHCEFSWRARHSQFWPATRGWTSFERKGQKHEATEKQGPGRGEAASRAWLSESANSKVT